MGRAHQIDLIKRICCSVRFIANGVLPLKWCSKKVLSQTISYLDLETKRNSAYTLPLKSLLTFSSVWSKTTLKLEKRGHFFLCALCMPIFNNFQLMEFREKLSNKSFHFYWIKKWKFLSESFSLSCILLGIVEKISIHTVKNIRKKPCFSSLRVLPYTARI